MCKATVLHFIVVPDRIAGALLFFPQNGIYQSLQDRRFMKKEYFIFC